MDVASNWNLFQLVGVSIQCPQGVTGCPSVSEVSSVLDLFGNITWAAQRLEITCAGCDSIDSVGRFPAPGDTEACEASRVSIATVLRSNWRLIVGQMTDRICQHNTGK